MKIGRWVMDKKEMKERRPDQNKTQFWYFTVPRQGIGFMFNYKNEKLYGFTIHL